MFHKVLIANRGEIAVRVAVAARELGVRTVAVYSDADAESPHVLAADEAVRIGPAAARDSYLSVDALIAAATRAGADAVHPGYGFLSENAAFAQACADAGLVFIGPPPAVIELMGDKRAAKNAVEAAGVRGVPGYQGDDCTDATLLREAAALGAPLMVKASAGGGGRGMRLVHDLADLPDALRAARAEATAAFGNGDLLLERAVLRARHVEVQVFADTHGHVVHLGERDCSAQRRHQKVIEEAPSPAVTPALREAMGSAAVAVARACGYVGAGTVEFLLEPDGSFWFLEMNTRLQVEHPVTEEVTLLDLAALQLRVAAGQPLPFAQEDVTLQGHAIEARLYAEDADRGFLPQTGQVLAFAPPDGVRFDHAIAVGATVSPHYDPMLGKLVAFGRDRGEALRKLAAALDDLVLLGVTTNRSWLARVLRHPTFVAGEATTAFLGEEVAALRAGPPTLDQLAVAALVALVQGAPDTPPDRLGWRSGRDVPATVVLEVAGDEDAAAVPLRVSRRGAGHFAVRRGEELTHITLVAASDDALTVVQHGVRRTVPFARVGPRCFLPALTVTDITQRPAASADGGTGTLIAPLDGAVTAVFVQAGEAVTRGQLLLVMEAMKMEHRLVADVDGTVVTLRARVGDQVKTRQLLAVLEEAAT
jgi:geranyl-CoA carboxylase alpha subunit